MCVHFPWIKNFYFLKIDAECFHCVWEKEELTFISTHLMLGSVTGIVWTLSCSVSYQEPKWGDGHTISSWWQTWYATHCLDSLESSFMSFRSLTTTWGLSPVSWSFAQCSFYSTLRLSWPFSSSHVSLLSVSFLFQQCGYLCSLKMDCLKSSFNNLIQHLSTDYLLHTRPWCYGRHLVE